MKGRYLDGREIKYPPRFFLGAAASPFSSNPKFQALREQKKVNAGAQFFQTNLVFDIRGDGNLAQRTGKAKCSGIKSTS